MKTVALPFPERPHLRFQGEDAFPAILLWYGALAQCSAASVLHSTTAVNWSVSFLRRYGTNVMDGVNDSYSRSTQPGGITLMKEDAYPDIAQALGAIGMGVGPYFKNFEDRPGDVGLVDLDDAERCMFGDIGIGGKIRLVDGAPVFDLYQDRALVDGEVSWIKHAAGSATLTTQKKLVKSYLH